MKKEIKELIHHQKMGGDLLLEVSDFDPNDQRIYHPAIWRNAWIGGLAAGTIVALLFWAVALGYLPIAGLGQIGASGGAVAAFFGFSIGSALGGFAGAVSGLSRLVGSRSHERKVEI